MGNRQNSCVLIGWTWKFQICSVQSQRLFGDIATAHFIPLSFFFLSVSIDSSVHFYSKPDIKMDVEHVRLVREECLLFRGLTLWISFKPQDESIWLKSDIHAHPHYKHIILLRAVSHFQTGIRNCWVMSRLNHCVQVQSQVSHLSSKVSFYLQTSVYTIHSPPIYPTPNRCS